MKFVGPSFWHGILKWRRPLAGVFLFALVAGVFAMLYQGRSFLGQTTFQVLHFSGTADLLPLLNPHQIVTDVAKTKKLAENWNLTETEFIEKCLGMVEISLEKESDTITVDVYGADPVEAAALANAMRNCFEMRLNSVEMERITRKINEKAIELRSKIKIQEKEVDLIAKELEKANARGMISGNPQKISSPDSTDGLDRLKAAYASKSELLQDLRISLFNVLNDDYLPHLPMMVLKRAKPDTTRVWRIPPVPHLAGFGAAAIAATVLLFRKGVRSDPATP